MPSGLLPLSAYAGRPNGKPALTIGPYGLGRNHPVVPPMYVTKQLMVNSTGGGGGGGGEA